MGKSLQLIIMVQLAYACLVQIIKERVTVEAKNAKNYNLSHIII